MLFAKLRALREFERRHLKQLSTVEDLDLVCEIGFHQEKGQPLSIKQLYLLNLASVATIQRRLRRLRPLPKDPSDFLVEGVLAGILEKLPSIFAQQIRATVHRRLTAGGWAQDGSAWGRWPMPLRPAARATRSASGLSISPEPSGSPAGRCCAAV